MAERKHPDNGNAKHHLKVYRDHDTGGIDVTSNRGDYYATHKQMRDKPATHSRHESRYKHTGEEVWGSVIGYTGDTIGLIRIKKLMNKNFLLLAIVAVAAFICFRHSGGTGPLAHHIPQGYAAIPTAKSPGFGPYRPTIGTSARGAKELDAS